MLLCCYIVMLLCCCVDVLLCCYYDVGCTYLIYPDLPMVHAYNTNDTLQIFLYSWLIIVTNPTLCPTYNKCPPSMTQYAWKMAIHGSWRLLPLASPMCRWRPHPVHRPHPHIIGNAACAWFGCPTCMCWGIWYDRHVVKVLDLSATMFYNDPSSNVPPIVSFSVPNAPVSPSTLSPMNYLIIVLFCRGHCCLHPSCRSNLTILPTFLRKSPAHVIFGMYLVLVHFWIDVMIWNCFAIWSVFINPKLTDMGTFQFSILQAPIGVTWLICHHVELVPDST